MTFIRHHLFAVAIVVAAAACAGVAAGSSSVATRTPSAAAQTRPCGLRLPPPVRGQLAFRLPSGGRAERRRLAGRLALCTLLRRDGSRFASLYQDSSQRVLSVQFYRPNGVLRRSSGAAHAAKAAETGSDVRCASSSQASIGSTYWRTTKKWWIGATVKGINRDTVVKAVRNAQSAWTNNTNWCGIKDQANPPASYQGKTSRSAKLDGYSTIDWGSLKNDQDCSGALACTAIDYDQKGSPVEADIRFNSAFKWSTKGAAGAYDIQAVATHEIGHVTQFDHVSNASKKDYTVVMWPYMDVANTSARKLGRGDAIANNSNY